MIQYTQHRTVQKIRPLSFRKLLLVMVLAGTIPFTAIMQYVQYLLVFTALILVFQALVTMEPEKISRFISFFIIAALFSFAHSVLSWHSGAQGDISYPIQFLMGEMNINGNKDFMVKSSLILGVFLIAHTALVRFTVNLTGASTGLFMGKRIPERGTGIYRDREKGIILQNDTIQDRRMFLRVGHYFLSNGSIGTMIYRSYLVILFMICLMLVGILLYNGPHAVSEGSNLIYLFGSAILHVIIGIIPFTLVTIATTLLAMRLSFRHTVQV